MKLSLEIPTKLLKLVSPLADFEFILAQEVLSDPDYAAFYSASKRYKVLDNGLHELNEPLTVPELQKAADLVRADLVIAPDYRRDAKNTYEGFREARRRLGPGPGIGLVLQGETEEERLKLFMAARGQCAMLLLPFRENRLAWFQSLCLAMPKHLSWPPKLHLLGMSTLAEAQAFRDMFRTLKIEHRCSIDTGKPVQIGLRREAYTEQLDLRGRKAPAQSGPADPEQVANIFYNVAYTRKYI